jgi:mannose-1-phosphate guanylyltransferase
LVLAGGFGRRLESLTRRLFGEAIPKQFCRFEGGRSLIQQTLDRLAPLVAPANTSVVVDASQVARARAQLVGPRDVALVEQPCDRGTAAGVLLPLLDLLRRAPDARVVVAASDHGVADEELFRATIARADAVACATPAQLVLIGAQPDGPERDYGWIVAGPSRDATHAPVARFVEKPDAAEAAALHASERALWNTFVLVGAARAWRDLFARRLPELTTRLRELRDRWPDGGAEFAAAYAGLPAANFSADVLGGAASLAVVALPRAAGWTDLGTEARLLEWLARKAVAAPELVEA